MSNTFHFPRARRLIGKADFHSVFLDELLEQESKINLERYCEEGFPDPESIEFEVASVEPTAIGCTVTVKCQFDEAVATGCADIQFNHPAVKELVFELEGGQGAAEVSYE
jgi:hypothetical protein